MKKRLEKLLEIAKLTDDQSVFTEFFPEFIQNKLDHIDSNDLPLSNYLFSVKDLIDVSGYVSRAGSVFLAKEPAAIAHADVVRYLIEFGATAIGHTNMTELAYSGLGLNPHYGTAENPFKRGHIAGGSTSGGAVSVASGLVDVAIGSDTGGSLRIPAAFTGLVGFKPTQASVSRKGCLPLSNHLDSIGPIARSVLDCEKIWQVISNQNLDLDHKALESKGVISDNFGFDSLDPIVLSGFIEATSRIKQLIPIANHHFSFLDQYKRLPAWHFSAVESRAYYEKYYQTQQDKIDPQVYLRMKRADEVTAIDYQKTLYQRENLIAQATKELGENILILPTVAILPPKINDCLLAERFNQLNLLALRNTSLANVIDGCSISIPYRYQDEWIGIMLIAAQGEDRRLLYMAKEIENILK